MKWWLIVNVFSVMGHTQFDLEYDSLTECVKAQRATQKQEYEKGYTAIWTLECRRFPIQAELPERSTRT